jgi:hypothetical protein
VVLVVLFVAQNAIVGADAYWLVALGDHIARTGSVPEGVPFAAAPTTGWPNPIVLAQLLFASLHSLGGATGLVCAQVAAVAATLALVVLDARRLGARDPGCAVVVLLLAAGSLRTLGVVRVEMLSLVPFALLVLLLRSEYRRPSARAWLLVPLLAVWSNLHGAVLMGFAVAGSYLLLSRLRQRPVETVAIGVAGSLALWATPALLRTAGYYAGVFGNEAAHRGSDLWARPSLSGVFDVLLILSALVLVGAALRRRLPLWEYAALAGLALATMSASRHGLWLLLFAAAPAAAHLRRRPSSDPVTTAGAEPPAASGGRRALVPAVGLVLVVVVGWVVVSGRGEATEPADPALVGRVATLAGHGVVLAPEPLAESLAVAGVTVWAGDPVDAFRRPDQAAYLDFLTGGPRAGDAVGHADVVVAKAGSPALAAVASDGSFTLASDVDGWQVYRRIPR